MGRLLVAPCHMDRHVSGSVAPKFTAASPGSIPIQGLSVVGRLLLLKTSHMRGLVPDHPVPEHPAQATGWLTSKLTPRLQRPGQGSMPIRATCSVTWAPRATSQRLVWGSLLAEATS